MEKNKNYGNLLFIILFAGFCWMFNFQETFLQPPQSVHTWRQTNCLSMTQMYYQYDVPFLNLRYKIRSATKV